MSSVTLFSQKDTVYTIDQSFEDIIKAVANDSMIHDKKANKLILYGQAQLFYEEISLLADYIEVDLKKEEVFATHGYDKDSNRIGMPLFKQDGEEILAKSIRYNFNTEKGYIQEVNLKQEENYLYMEVAKRQANEEIHFKKGRFSTCDLAEPHFHFHLSKAILIPEKRIVSGPMNLWVQGVPTPLGLPFVFIPQKKIEKQQHGFVFPQYSLQSPYGMGFQRLGYFIPINDSLQTTFYGDLYTRGTWGLSNETSYNIKYKFQGNINLGFQRLKLGVFDTLPVKKMTFIWSHRQDRKANPIWNFSSSINFISDNNPKLNLDPLNQNYFNNSLNSDVNLTRAFPNKPIVLGVKMSARQNSTSKNIALILPSFNLNVARFSPLNFLTKNNKNKWASQLAMTYSLDGQNKSTFGDSLLDRRQFDKISQGFMNGIQQNATLQSTFNLLKGTWKLTPSLTYANRINFQQTRKYYDLITNSTLVDTISEVGMSHNLNLNATLTTVIYSYYKFIGKRKALLRHIITPSFSYRYTPQLNNVITDSVGVNKAIVEYSPFERSVYADVQTSESEILSFGFNNTFELKRKSDRDTITGFQKTKIIDALSLTGLYDLRKDSMNFSRINVNLRINPIPLINIVAVGSFGLYDYDETTNLENKQFLYAQKGKLARMYSLSINSGMNFSNEKGKKRIKENKIKFQDYWNAELDYFALHPEQLIDFEIPWRVSLNYVYSINRITNTIITERQFNFNHTLQLSSDINITQRWKLINETYIDLQSKKLINSSLSLSRNLHCWSLSFFWVPIGNNQSFLFRLNANSTLFQDAKIELKKPPVLF